MPDAPAPPPVAATPVAASVVPAPLPSAPKPSAPKPSPAFPITSTSYGLVMAPPPAPRPPSLEFEVRNLDPMLIADFHPYRRRAGHVLLAILILAVIGAILATILSYQLNV
jgi:hypothetical protein